MKLQNRTLETERRYTLKDYEHIMVKDILELQEDTALDSETVELVRYLQLLSIEKTYRKYILLREELSKKFPGVTSSLDVVAYIEELQSDTLDQITKLFKNGDVKDDN